MTWWIPLVQGLAVQLVTSSLDPAAFQDFGTETWAGHQVVLGERKVPFLGKLKTRVDTFLIARVQRGSDGIELVQKACSVRFAKVAGVKVEFDGQHIPIGRVRFDWSEDEGAYTASPRIAWGDDDVDDDGKPGLTVDVDAGLCSGTLYVANDQRTTISAVTNAAGALVGDVRVSLEQEILGVEGRCLEMVSKDTREISKGRIGYTPVPNGTDCDDLSTIAWPVRIKP